MEWADPSIFWANRCDICEILALRSASEKFSRYQSLLQYIGCFWILYHKPLSRNMNGMPRKWIFVATILAAIPRVALSCGTLGGTDSEIFQNPTLSWRMSPPAAWTYPQSYAQQTASFFPGQPLTLADATAQSSGDLQAATLEALTAANIITTGVRVISNYQPQQIGDCLKVAGTTPAPASTMIGDIIGIYEQGAIVYRVTVAVAISVTDCATRGATYGTGTVNRMTNEVAASVSIQGVSLSGFQLKQVVAQLQNTLTFTNRVRFTTPITYQ